MSHDHRSEAPPAPPPATPSNHPLLLLLAQPERAADTFEAPQRLLLLAIGLIGLAVYGAAAGTFGTIDQMGAAALKLPTVALGSLLLCLPHLYVALGLAGVQLARREWATLLSGLVGLWGVLALSVLPISWLFSVSSRWLPFVVLLQVGIWLFVLLTSRRFAQRLLARHLEHPSQLTSWILLLLLASLQLTTQLRPILSAELAADEPARLLFLEQFWRILSAS